MFSVASGQQLFPLKIQYVSGVETSECRDKYYGQFNNCYFRRQQGLYAKYMRYLELFSNTIFHKVSATYYNF